MSFYRNQLEEYISKLRIEADTVIDVGGGDKPMTKRNISNWKVNKYLILDNDRNFNPDIYGDINYPPIHFQWKDSEPQEKVADVVLCFEVMEYVWDPVQAHKSLYRLLKPGGTVYISYPTIYPLHNPPGIDYLRYTKNAINKLLFEANFLLDSIDITPRIATNGFNDLANFYSREGMHPLKGTGEVYDIGYMATAKKGEEDA